MIIILSTLFLALLAICIWASLEIPLWEEWAQLSTSPWFLTTLVDLYIGLILAGLFTYWLHRKWVYSLIWTLIFFSLGNMATIIWIVLNRKALYDKCK